MTVPMSRLTGRESQAGFKLTGFQEKTRLLKRPCARTEVLEVPAHDVPQAQISRTEFLQGTATKSNGSAEISVFSSARWLIVLKVN
jgi:hypothetical protein